MWFLLLLLLELKCLKITTRSLRLMLVYSIFGLPDYESRIFILKILNFYFFSFSGSNISLLKSILVKWLLFMTISSYLILNNAAAPRHKVPISRLHVSVLLLIFCSLTSVKFMLRNDVKGRCNKSKKPIQKLKGTIQNWKN